MHTVVVTGASGFIGSSLIKKLRSCSSFEAIGVARSDAENVDLKVKDYADSPTADVLIHLAEERDIGVLNAWEDGCAASEETLAILLNKDYRRVFYASSAAVYGDDKDRPFVESDTANPGGYYAHTKLRNEQRVLKANGVVMRFANVIGQSMATNNVISDILHQIPGDGALSVRDGSPVRDYIWVDDVTEAICSLLKQSENGVFNIGTGVGTSVKQLAQAALVIAMQAFRAVESKQLLDTGSRNVLDISKISSLTSWEPVVDINRALSYLLKEQSGVAETESKF